jgi:hypothetical protein
MPKVAAAAERLYGPLAKGFGGRIKAALQGFSSKADAAAAMALSKDQVNTLIAEKAVPNFASMAGLSRSTGVSLDWLAFSSSEVSDLSTGSFFSAADDTVLLARLDDGARLPFSRTWLKQTFDRSPDQLGIISAPGAAMEPYIKRGALLLIDLAFSSTFDGEVFLFDFGGDLVVRRTQRETDGSLLLRADNASFGPLSLAASATDQVKGRVVWIGSVA